MTRQNADNANQANLLMSETTKVAQKNAASAEESVSTAEEVNVPAETMKGYVGELMALVGGRNGNGMASVGAIHESPVRGSEIRKSDGNGKRHVSLPVHGTQTGLFVAKAAHGVKKDVRIPASIQKEPKPEHVIPMEKEDFKEF